MSNLIQRGEVNQMNQTNQTPIETWIEKWGANLDWEAKAKLREAVQETHDQSLRQRVSILEKEIAELVKAVQLIDETNAMSVVNISLEPKLNVQDLAAALKKTRDQLASSL